MKKFYTLAIIFLSLGMTSQLMAQFEMLYVSKPENQVDIDLIDYFTLEGYNVTSVPEEEFKAEGGLYSTEAGYVGFDVLFVSESIGSSSANNYKMAGFPIPCVATEGFVAKTSRWGLLADDSDTFFKQASSANLTADVLTMVITNGNHFITSELGQDYNLLWASADDPTKLGVTSFDLSADIPAAVPLADYLFDMGDLSAIWAIPEGAVMRETDTLPNMVIIGLIQTDVGQSFTGDMQMFFVNCIRWVTGDYDNTGVDLFKTNRTDVYPNPTDGAFQLRFSQLESGRVTVHIYDHTGRIMKTLTRGSLDAGSHVLSLDLSDVREGPYIYELVTGKERLRGRIVKQ